MSLRRLLHLLQPVRPPVSPTPACESTPPRDLLLWPSSEMGNTNSVTEQQQAEQQAEEAAAELDRQEQTEAAHEAIQARSLSEKMRGAPLAPHLPHSIAPPDNIDEEAEEAAVFSEPTASTVVAATHVDHAHPTATAAAAPSISTSAGPAAAHPSTDAPKKALTPAASAVAAQGILPSSAPAELDGSPDPPTPSVRTTGGPAGIGEAHLDLWYALVEWVSESLDSGVVLAWDSEEVGHRVLALPTSPALLEPLAKKQVERKRARLAALRAKQAAQSQQAEASDKTRAGATLAPVELQSVSSNAAAAASSASAAEGDSSASAAAASVPLLSLDTVPFHLASDLLVVDRALARLRHASVPSRVSEDTFWQCYFAAMRDTIREHVLSLQQPEEQLQDRTQFLAALDGK